MHGDDIRVRQTAGDRSLAGEPGHVPVVIRTAVARSSSPQLDTHLVTGTAKGGDFGDCGLAATLGPGGFHRAGRASPSNAC